MSSSKQTAYRLSWGIVVLMAVSSFAGLFFHDLYRDNELVAASWYGNDLVTLIVATPLLIGALIGARRGSKRALLVWLGMVAYSLYNAAFYLFGAAFNSLFLVYAALYTLSAFALVFGLAALDVDALFERVQAQRLSRWIGGYMILVGLSLGGFYTMLSLIHIGTGQIPPMIAAVGGKTNLIGALDLSMVVSVALLGGVWLWQRRPWGYVLAVLWNVKGAAYMGALSAATASTLLVGPSDDWTQLLLWGPIGVGCLLSSLVLLSALRPSRPRHQEQESYLDTADRTDGSSASPSRSTPRTP